VLGVTRDNLYIRCYGEGLQGDYRGYMWVRIYWIRGYREEVICDIWYEGYKKFKGWVLDIVKNIRVSC
jgi:hypothetical protein